MRERHMTVTWSGVGTTCSTTRSAGTRGRRRLDTGQHELQRVHAMCPPAPEAAKICTEPADEPKTDPRIGDDAAHADGWWGDAGCGYDCPDQAGALRRRQVDQADHPGVRPGAQHGAAVLRSSEAPPSTPSASSGSSVPATISTGSVSGCPGTCRQAGQRRLLPQRLRTRQGATRVGAILPHRAWTAADAGEGTCRGALTLPDGRPVLLVERRDEVLVLALDSEQAQAAAELADGQAVQLGLDGMPQARQEPHQGGGRGGRR